MTRSMHALGCVAIALSLAAYGTARADIVHRYTFNDGTANDSAGSLNGVLTNHASVSGGKLVLDGTDDYLSLGNGIVPTASANGTTIVAWFNASTTIGDWTRVFDFGSGPANSVYFTPYIIWEARRNGVYFEPAAGVWGGTPLNDGIEHMAAVTITPNGGTNGYGALTLYVDGASVGSIAMTSSLSTLASGPCNYLGKSQYLGNNYFQGSIDELRVYDTVLDATAIGSLSPTVPEPSLMILMATGLLGFLAYAWRKRR